MNDLHEFILRDVRCFRGEHCVKIRPITLLVGENSTGKTSFLGSYRVLCDAINDRSIRQPLDNFHFNLEPFQMGAFRDIVRLKRRKPSEPAEFVLGFSIKNKNNGNKKYDVLFTFIEKGSEPVVSSMCFKFSQNSFLKISRLLDEEFTIEIPNHTTEFSNFFSGSSFFHLADFLLCWSNVEDLVELLGVPKKEAKMLIKFIQQKFGVRTGAKDIFSKRNFGLYPELEKIRSIAPLRSKPRRTYDPVGESPTSEGGHIPMLMARLLRTKDEGWNILHDDLVEFGLQSGLFSEIEIKSHGKQTSDPFQLQVKVRKGPQSNIMDVGYGVNQILPILVEIMYSKPTTFLLQQPEVHLHPRGQAEFSSFLAKSVNKKGHSFLIETHSDYIIDRVRMSVRDGIIKPEDVSILYFEPGKTGNAVTIHNMEVDDQGNLENVPSGYRDFFMKETDKLLGFA